MAIRREQQSVPIVDRAVRLPVINRAMTFTHGLAAMHHGRIIAYTASVPLALLLALAAGFDEIIGDS
jgi:hypothetical protein